LYPLSADQNCKNKDPVHFKGKNVRCCSAVSCDFFLLQP